MTDSRDARRRRVARLDLSRVDDLFALRDALVRDPDAETRAAAALRLDPQAASRLAPYLRDATEDPSLAVREAAFVALGRARDRETLALAKHACSFDRAFRVRRAAVVCAARVAGVAAAGVLATASRDPFWRVRVTARRLAARLDVVIEAHPGADEDAETAVARLDDPDPAVVAARVAHLGDALDPSELVPALGHSHLALRRLAVTHLGRRGDEIALRAATRWLVDPRVPYGPDAAEAALARSGARGVTLAATILDAPDALHLAPGVLSWALRSVPAVSSWTLLVGAASHDDPGVRLTATRHLAATAPDRDALTTAMTARLQDTDARVRALAGAWLARTRSRAGREALMSLDPSAQPTALRALLVDVYTQAHDAAALRRLAADGHGAVRAAAVRALLGLGSLGPTEIAEAERDPDPWVRRAVLRAERAHASFDDPARSVRETALALSCSSTERTAWARRVTPSVEPVPALRAVAVTWLRDDHTSDATKTLLGLSRDTDPGVRSGAVAALGTRREDVVRLLSSGALDAPRRMAAYSLGWLSDDTRVWPEHDAEVLAHLRLLTDAVAGRAPVVEAREKRDTVDGPPHRRELGRTGLFVSPFALSGAHGLSFDDFALARTKGVSLFFWEPSHRVLTRYLRSEGGVRASVVCGTYHADAASIERDVQRARRALRRDRLDVLLAFWTRSMARLDAVEDTLRRLVASGRVRAIGISTHDRALARAAAERGLDVVMVRHSAAHRGAETEVFPHCAARGTAVLTFSNVSYGRLLHGTTVLPASSVSAADLYRYSLSQPGVHACIAAPRRHGELVEDLAVLEQPALALERQDQLRRHGDEVYVRSKAWASERWAASTARPEPAPALTMHRPDAFLARELEEELW